LTNPRSYADSFGKSRMCIWKLASIYDVEGWRTRLPRTHAGLPCVPIHMHILLSPDGHVMRAVHMHMQILHRLCKFRKFAQSRGRLCIFFSICTGFFIRWTCVFHDMCKFSICTATDGDGLNFAYRDFLVWRLLPLWKQNTKAVR